MQPAGGTAVAPDTDDHDVMMSRDSLPRPEGFDDDRDDIEPGDRTLLIIENDANFAKVLLEMAREKGFKGLCALDGEGGLKLAHAFEPDAITLDIDMPGMDGWAVLDALKADPEVADIPVVLFTGMAEDRSEAFRRGASDLVTKPVDSDRLAAVLKRFCPGSAAQRVLVVDDDPDLRQRLRAMLEKQGLAVDEAGDGRAALTRLDEQWPGLILLDLLMPEMDGFSFLAELQRRGEGRSVPVIVLTAKDLTSAERQRLSGPIGKILRKGSLGHEQLLAEVSALMAGYDRRQ
jgi:CheY-like chemotaxis protein